MKATRLAFCDSSVLLRWVTHLLAEQTNREILSAETAHVSEVVNALESPRREGVRLASTITGAAHIVTYMYKQGPAFSGDIQGFPVRKSFARIAAGILNSSVELIALRPEHFHFAQELWYELFVRDEKQAYAEFLNYVEAALILGPPENYTFTHVFLGHAHIQYILRKKKSKAMIQKFRFRDV